MTSAMRKSTEYTFIKLKDEEPERDFEKEWAKQFEGIYNQQPDWYEDSSGRAFNAIILSSMVSDFNSAATTAMASQPSSAAGGGGGGSW